MENHERRGQNKIIKKHFKFYYNSPSSNQEIPILLDVIYEKHGYAKVIKKYITNKFLILEGDLLQVTVPSIESLLGDKLTAFAPHTTGIEYKYTNTEGVQVSKHLEVIKQFLDVAILIEQAKDFDTIYDTYSQIVRQEIEYRGLSITKEDALKDTFNMALSIISKGTVYSDDYTHLLSGIKKIKNRVFEIKVNGENVARFAANIMLMTAKLLTQVKDIKITQKNPIAHKKFKSINHLKKIDPFSYNTAVTALELLELI